MNDVIRIGNAQAFWGDRPTAAHEILTQVPHLDFLTMDYLAEVSMSILALQRERDGRRGYAEDFVDVIMGLADYWAAGGRCRLIANAGGLNPQACAHACQAVLDHKGCRSLKIGVVFGDDCLAVLKATGGPAGASQTSFANLDSHAPISTVRDRLVTANAYMGCEGIARALDAGADLVITGRVADPSMVVAACVHAFGWKQDAWDALAGATVAGHLLECGTHVTGGIATDWLNVPDPAHLGFPIAEIGRAGECVITKPDHTGGMVTEETVKEQLVYEIGDPSRYVSPDVTVSFQDVHVDSIGPNRIRVRGAKGSPRTSSLKVSATYRDGYRAAGMVTLFGPESVRKAKRCGEIVRQRLHEAGYVYRDWIVECLGTADSVPVLSREHRCQDAYETVLRMAVESDSELAVQAFTRELMPLVTAGPQGTTGYAEGRPRVHPIFRYWPSLIDIKEVLPHVEIIATLDTLSRRLVPPKWPPETTVQKPILHQTALSVHVDKPRTLADVAYGRSGDKGTGANIGILVRSNEHYAWLLHWLTAERVAAWFAGIGVESVQRYELPHLAGVNFVLLGILRRGIRNDAQGKALAQALLSIPIDGSSPDMLASRPSAVVVGSHDEEETIPWVDQLTIGEVLRHTACTHPDRPAVVMNQGAWRATWAELDREVDRVARALVAMGFQRGDHFGVWATNVPEWLLLQCATARIGIVLVTVNPSYRTSELAFVIRQAELKGIALIDQFKSTDYHASLCEAVPELASSTPGELNSHSFPALRAVVSIRGKALPGAFSWDDMMRLAESVEPAALEQAELAVRCDDPINIQFTSGTTGLPKGATLSHRNVLLNGYYAGVCQRMTPHDRICIPVPLYHCFGCVLGTLCSLTHGATMVFPAESFQAEMTLNAIEAERCTAVYGVPTMFIAMLEHADYPTRDLKSLRTGIMAGSPCPIELMKRVTGEMGASEMTIGYGLTEASPLITQTRVNDSLELRVGTVGRVLPGVEAIIVDPETGKAMPDGMSGELCARGHGVMLGYFNLPEATAKAIDSNGWLHSGDMAMREPNGYFRITGRLKDLVIRGGENICPREIEEVLYQHPAVKDVQVIGVPDRKFGEQVMAWVCFRHGRHATEVELKALCKTQLAHFKVPHYWKFVDAFPTTVTGKIQKFKMRAISIEELGLGDVAQIETA